MVTRKIPKQKVSEKTLETLLNSNFKQYMAIILFTWHFQNATRRGGLELKHYRYALVQKDDLKRDKKAMYNFFERPRESNEENHLKDDLTAIQYRMMCERKEIEKCISSRNNLSKTYLKNLVKADILIKDIPDRKITDDVKGKYNLKPKKETPRYSINPKKEREMDFLIRKYQLKKWITNKIDDSNEDNFQTLEKDFLKILTDNSQKKIYRPNFGIQAK